MSTNAPSKPKPALLINRSGEAQHSRATTNNRWAAPGSAKSRVARCTVAPRCSRSSEARASKRALSRETSRRSYPPAARARAYAAPIPREAPVMTAKGWSVKGRSEGWLDMKISSISEHNLVSPSGQAGPRSPLLDPPPSLLFNQGVPGLENEPANHRPWRRPWLRRRGLVMPATWGALS